MKNTSKIIGALLLTAAAATSCVDDSLLPYEVPAKPGNLEDYEYLKDYDVLKSYLDRSAHPNFKVSAAVEASDFQSGSAVTRIVSTNFDEVVAGNAFKMASVVDDKGNMNFSTVQAFVANAESNGLTVYGHTLAWHSQQPVKWLNALIADKPIPVDPDAEQKQVQDGFVDFTTMTSFPYYVMGYTPTFDGGCLHSEFPGDWYQYFIADGISLKEGNYSAIVRIKSDREGSLALNMGWGWGEGEQANGRLAVTDDWTESEVKFTGIPEKSVNLVLQPGTFEGPIDIEWVKVVHYEAGNSNVEYVTVYDNQITNSEMKEGESMDCFIVRDAVKNDEPADVIVGGGPNGMNCIKVVGKTNPAEEWDTQFFIYTPEKKWEAGEKYKLHMWYKASKAIGTDSQVHGTPGGYIHWQMLNPNPSFTTEWKEQTWEGTIPGEGAGNQQSIAFNLNKNKADDPGTTIEYYFAGIEWSAGYEKEVPKTEEQYVKKRCIIVESDDMQEHEWDTQFWIQTNEPFHAGDKYEFKAEVRADFDASPGTQIHKGSAGGYIHWAAIGNPQFTTEWETVTASGSIPAEGDGGDFIAWNLNDFNGANRYYFGSISFKINGVEMLNNTDLQGDDISSFWKKEKRGATINAPISDGYTIVTEIKSTIPLTEEEKRDTLTWAMNKWVTGMMNATEGKVKAWDLINEAISGADKDGDGKYDLQTATPDSKDFFWQDYLGAEQYGAVMSKLAREAYANIEGDIAVNPADLKLFINDYNLESTWDDNKKLESLIEWIKIWEANGAQIDGIGSQMHISYYLDANDQENQKKHITKMLEMMVKSGKLVRISELDMGVADKQFGKALTNSEMTLEIEKAMADYYQWIVEEYLKVVPAEQQYGICQWCLTDAPKNSGWRADEPVGLWYQDYTRKPAYAGWAEGLKKK